MNAGLIPLGSSPNVQALPNYSGGASPELLRLIYELQGQTSEEAEAGQRGLMERATPPTSVLDKLLNPQRGTLPMLLLSEDQNQAFLSDMAMGLMGTTSPFSRHLPNKGGEEVLKQLRKLRKMEEAMPPLEKSRELLLKAFEKLWEQMNKVKK